MSNLYLKRPVINHDTEDGDGVRAEVRVTYGCGIVKQVEDKRKNALVVINTDTKYTQNSYLLIESDLYPMVQESLAKERPIIFRIETIRKEGVDRTIKFDDLLEQHKDNLRDVIVKQLTAVKWEEEDEWVIADNIYTLIEEDGFNTPPNPYKLKKAKKSRERGSIEKEGAPWENRNFDNSINLGSNLVMATIGSVGLARTTLEKAGIDYKDKELYMLGSALFKLSNRLQKRAFVETGTELKPRIDYASNTRARGLIYSEIEHNPLSKDVFSDKQELKQWLEAVEDGAFLVWKMAIKIGESEIG